jgi:hypothetical protein
VVDLAKLVKGDLVASGTGTLFTVDTSGQVKLRKSADAPRCCRSIPAQVSVCAGRARQNWQLRMCVPLTS